MTFPSQSLLLPKHFSFFHVNSHLMSTHHVARTENISRDVKSDNRGPCPQGVYNLAGRVVTEIKNYNTGQAKQDEVCTGSTQCTKAGGIYTVTWRKTGWVSWIDMSGVLRINRSLQVDTVKKVISEREKRAMLHSKNVCMCVCEMQTHRSINITIV